MSRVLWFLLFSLEPRTDKVPESIADQCVEVLQIDQCGEFVFHTRVVVRESDAGNDVFFDVL